jgi:hypothetical protein
VGIGDFFKRRRANESALPDGMTTGGAPAPADDVPWAKDLDTIGQQIPTAGVGMTGAPIDLAQLGTQIQQAFASGNVQVQQMQPQVIDARGTGLRDEIFEIMKQHGIDPQSGATHDFDASKMPEMQAQIMAAMGQHGIQIPGQQAPPSGDS